MWSIAEKKLLEERLSWRHFFYQKMYFFIGMKCYMNFWNIDFFFPLTKTLLTYYVLTIPFKKITIDLSHKKTTYVYYKILIRQVLHYIQLTNMLQAQKEKGWTFTTSWCFHKIFIFFFTAFWQNLHFLHFLTKLAFFWTIWWKSNIFNGLFNLHLSLT